MLVEVPAGDAVALGINGTPLMQMMVFGVNGQVEEERHLVKCIAFDSDCSGSGFAGFGLSAG